MKRRDFERLRFWLRLLILTVPLWFGGVGFLFGWWSSSLLGADQWVAAMGGLLIGLAWWSVREVRGRARFRTRVNDLNARWSQIALLSHDQARQRALDAIAAGGHMEAHVTPLGAPSLPDTLHSDAREFFSRFEWVRWRVLGVDMDLGTLDCSLVQPIPDAPHQWTVGKMRDIEFVLNSSTGRVLMGIRYEGEPGGFDPEDGSDTSPSLWHFILERSQATETMAAAHRRRTGAK